MPENTSQIKLLEVFNRMSARYGRQHWWPAETWLEMMVGAVLTQATSWTNVEKAIANLKNAGALSPVGIRDISEEQLAKLVYPSGFYKAKAKKLKALAEFVGVRFGDRLESAGDIDIETLRSELLSVHGIGEETADDILLYAFNLPTFVIDTYTKRTFARLGLALENGAYSYYRKMFMDNLPPDVTLFGEYHALIVWHNKEVCRKRPVCHKCCLLHICPTGQAAMA